MDLQMITIVFLSLLILNQINGLKALSDYGTSTESVLNISVHSPEDRIHKRSAFRSLFGLFKKKPKSDNEEEKPITTSDIDFAREFPEDDIHEDEIDEKIKSLEELSGTISRDEPTQRTVTSVKPISSSSSSTTTSSVESETQRSTAKAGKSFDTVPVITVMKNESSKHFEDDYVYTDDIYVPDVDDGSNIDGLYNCPRKLCNFGGRCLSNRLGNEIVCLCRPGFNGSKCQVHLYVIFLWLLVAIVCLLFLGIVIIVIFKLAKKTKRSTMRSKSFRNFQLTPIDDFE